MCLSLSLSSYLYSIEIDHHGHGTPKSRDHIAWRSGGVGQPWQPQGLGSSIGQFVTQQQEAIPGSLISLQHLLKSMKFYVNIEKVE